MSCHCFPHIALFYGFLKLSLDNALPARNFTQIRGLEFVLNYKKKKKNHTHTQVLCHSWGCCCLLRNRKRTLYTNQGREHSLLIVLSLPSLTHLLRAPPTPHRCGEPITLGMNTPADQWSSLFHCFIVSVHPKSDSFSCSLSPSLVENVITCLLVLCLCMTAILFYMKHTTGPFYLATYSIFVATMYSYPGGSYGGVRICILSSVDNAVSPTKNHQNFPMEENTGNQKRMKVWGEERAELLIRKKDRNVSSFREQWGPPGWKAGNHFVVWGQWDAL